MFDLKQIGVDFITGVAIHFASKGVTAIKSKLTWNKSGTTTLQTGGRQIDYNAYIKRLETIDMEYENKLILQIYQELLKIQECQNGKLVE